MTEIRWIIHPDVEALRDAVATDTRRRIEAALAHQDHVLIGLPGGVTPGPIFARLAAAPLPWQRVTIIPSDDRLAPPDSPLNNASMIAGYFAPQGARIVPLADADLDLESAAQAADAELRKLQWPPAFIWLGMGTDGHTASLFPGPDLPAALASTSLAVGLRPDPLPPEAPVSRVTLSLRALAEAPALLLVINGEAKYSVLSRAVAEGPASALPVAHLMAAARNPVTVHWSP